MSLKRVKKKEEVSWVINLYFTNKKRQLLVRQEYDLIELLNDYIQDDSRILPNISYLHPLILLVTNYVG
jgi:hypothetical protein